MHLGKYCPIFLPRQTIKVKAFLHMVNSLQTYPPKKLIQIIWFQAFLQLSLSIYGIIIMPIILSILFKLLIPEGGLKNLLELEQVQEINQ